MSSPDWDAALRILNKHHSSTRQENKQKGESSTMIITTIGVGVVACIGYWLLRSDGNTGTTAANTPAAASTATVHLVPPVPSG